MRKMSNIEEQIKKQQEEINSLYQEHGLTDEVLEAQIELNKLRHEHDIHDKDKTLHENYVQ